MTMKRSDPTRTYDPAAGELTAAIEEVLKTNPSAEWREVHATLLNKNETWKVPERRVAKFVKRQNSVSPGSPSGRKSIAKSLSRKLSRGKGASSQQDSSTPGDRPDAGTEETSSVSSKGSLQRFFGRTKKSKKRNDAGSVNSSDVSSTTSKGSIRKLFKGRKGRSSSRTQEMANPEPAPSEKEAKDLLIVGGETMPADPAGDKEEGHVSSNVPTAAEAQVEVTPAPKDGDTKISQEHLPPKSPVTNSEEPGPATEEEPVADGENAETEGQSPTEQGKKDMEDQQAAQAARDGMDEHARSLRSLIGVGNDGGLNESVQSEAVVFTTGDASPVATKQVIAPRPRPEAERNASVAKPPVHSKTEGQQPEKVLPKAPLKAPQKSEQLDATILKIVNMDNLGQTTEANRQPQGREQMLKRGKSKGLPPAEHKVFGGEATLEEISEVKLKKEPSAIMNAPPPSMVLPNSQSYGALVHHGQMQQQHGRHSFHQPNLTSHGHAARSHSYVAHTGHFA